jgi:hypothetical protein
MQGVTLRRSADEIMLYDPVQDRIHMINDTAAAIWDLCDGETDPDEMDAAICQLTGLPDAVVEEDVARLLLGFHEAGLIAWVD